MRGEFFYMPRGKLNKDIIKCEVLKLKNKLYTENANYYADPKYLAHHYLNMVLDKINEYGS